MTSLPRMAKREIETSARRIGGNIHRARRMVRGMCRAARASSASLLALDWHVAQDAVYGTVAITPHVIHRIEVYTHLELVENDCNPRRLGALFGERVRMAMLRQERLRAEWAANRAAAL